MLRNYQNVYIFMLPPKRSICKELNDWPISAGLLRVLFSQRQADTISSAASIGSLTVSNITAVLSGQLTVVECEVFAYISPFRDLVVMVLPTVRSPSQLQVGVERCAGWTQYSNTLQWHNGRYGISNHQSHDCLLNRLFRRRSKKTSKLHITGLCVGNSPVTGEFG